MALVNITQQLRVREKKIASTWRHTEQEAFSPEASTLFLLVILIFGIFSTAAPGKPLDPPTSKILVTSSKLGSTAPIWLNTRRFQKGEFCKFPKNCRSLTLGNCVGKYLTLHGTQHCWTNPLTNKSTTQEANNNINLDNSKDSTSGTKSIFATKFENSWMNKVRL